MYTILAAIMAKLPILTKITPLIGIFKKYGFILLLVGVIGYQNLSPTRFVFFAPTIPFLSNIVKTQTQIISELTLSLEASKEMVLNTIEANNILSDSIDEQNAEIIKWKETLQYKQESINRLDILIRTQERISASTVDKILKGKTPSSCENSIQYLQEASSSLRWP